MFDLRSALAVGSPCQCTLNAVVLDQPRIFYGNRTHALHEAFHVESQGQRLEVVENLALTQRIPVAPGDTIEMHGELVPHGSHGPLMHWIHRDPQRRHENGYLIDHGVRYE